MRAGHKSGTEQKGCDNVLSVAAAWHKSTTTRLRNVISLDESRCLADRAGSTRALQPPSAGRAPAKLSGSACAPRTAPPRPLRWQRALRNHRRRRASAATPGGEARIGAGGGDWLREHLVPGCWALGDSQLVADQRLRPGTSLDYSSIGQSHTSRMRPHWPPCCPSKPRLLFRPFAGHARPAWRPH